MSQPYTLLIAEADIVRRRCLLDLFKDYFECLEAAKILEVLDVLQTTPHISAVLITAAMFGTNKEKTFLGRVRSEEMPDASVPVLVLVDGDASSDVRLFQLGANDVIHEPYHPDALCARVLATVRSRAAHRELLLRENAILREQMQIHMLVAYHANFDTLTGLYRRKAFYANASLFLHSRAGETFAIAVLDVDRFKVVNELFGTDVGDDILRRIGEILSNITATAGVCGRLDADRFAVCMPVAEFSPRQLLDKVSCGINEMSYKHNFIVHMGIFLVENTKLTVNQMCDRARLALKSVKNNYMTRYAYFDNALRHALVEEQQLYSEMDGALQHKHFCVYYQPIFNTITRTPIGAEALVRWNHPQRGLIAPNVFIPVFEKNDFIIQLDSYVWEEVCKFIHDSRKVGRTVVPISVNISRVNFHSPQLYDTLMGLLSKYNVEPSMLKLEITESAYSENSSGLINTIARLKEAGFSILMDDFGSGYSSLNMLKDVDVDVLKVDMLFLQGLEHSTRAANVIASIVRMAKWLNMTVVAEGVETEGQLSFLRSIGCESVQGYFLGRPMPKEAFSELMEGMTASPPLLVKDRLPSVCADDLWDAKSTSSLLLNELLGCIGIFEMHGKQLEVVRVNDAYFELFDDELQLGSQGNTSFLTLLAPEDRTRFLLAVHVAQNQGRIKIHDVRHVKKDGTEKLISFKICHIGSGQNSTLFYFSAQDTSLPKKRENTALSNAAFSDAALQEGASSGSVSV